MFNFPRAPLAPDFLDLDVDVAVVLVPFPDGVDVLLQLRLIEPAGFVDERIKRLALGLHLLAQNAIAELRVPFETDGADRALRALANRENHARRAACFVGIDPVFDVNIGEALPLISLDDFLARLLQFILAQRTVDLERDRFSQFLGADPLGALDLDLVHERASLEHHHHLHALAFRLSKDADVLHLAGFVERLDVLFDQRFGIGLAGLGANLREHFFFRDRLRPDVLHFDRGNDRRALWLGRRGLRNQRPALREHQNHREQSSRCTAADRTEKLLHNVKSPLASSVSDAARVVLMVNNLGIVKAGFAVAPGAGRRRTHRSALIQELVPIIPPARFVAGIADQSLDLPRIQAKRRPGAAHDVFLHHHGSEIIRAVLQRHLADLRPLRHPRALDVRNVVQENAGERLRPQIFRPRRWAGPLSGPCSPAETSSR